MTFDEDARPIDPQVRIGHVHLKVADLERSLRFYCGVLGFQITQRYGTQAAFVSAGVTGRFRTSHSWALQNQPPLLGVSGTLVDSNRLDCLFKVSDVERP